MFASKMYFLCIINCPENITCQTRKQSTWIKLFFYFKRKHIFTQAHTWKTFLSAPNYSVAKMVLKTWTYIAGFHLALVSQILRIAFIYFISIYLVQANNTLTTNKLPSTNFSLVTMYCTLLFLCTRFLKVIYHSLI